VICGKELESTLGRRVSLRAGALQNKRSADHDGHLSLYRLPANEFERVFVDRDDSERWI
jgi:hypothetical protein